jgi:hypothetical protein
VAFDFGKKEVRLGQPYEPTGSLEDDLKVLTRHFIDTKGKVPEFSFEVK